MADGRELNLELPIGARLRISSIEVLDYAVMLYLPHDGPDALISAIQCSKGGWLGFSNTEGRELTVGDLRQGLDLKAWVEGSASAQ